jgi:hypothetical protein
MTPGYGMVFKDCLFIAVVFNYMPMIESEFCRRCQHLKEGHYMGGGCNACALISIMVINKDTGWVDYRKGPCYPDLAFEKGVTMRF